MANFTQEAIKQAFIKLLNERPFHKITVKDIVNECGINRNSFYYHYQDIPSLAEEIGRDTFESIISRFSSMDNMSDCLYSVAEFCLSNRRVIMSLYRSQDKELLEKHIWKLSDRIVKKVNENAFGGRQISSEDLRLISTYIRGSCYGHVMDWLDRGMPESILSDIPRYCELNRLLIDGLLNNLDDHDTRK